MTKEIKLSAKIRKNIEGKLEKITSNDMIPGNIYGSGSENINLEIKKQDFEKVYDIAGESNLIDLSIDEGEAVKVLVKEVQKDVVKNKPIHVDFYKVDMTKKITTEIPLEFIGESKAVKDLGGMLSKNLDSVEVECLPSDLVDHINVDISVLNTFDDNINLEDLKIPDGLELTSETNDLVVTVTEPRVQEEPEEEAATEGEIASGEESKEEAPKESDTPQEDKKE